MRQTSFDNILLSSFIPFESPVSFPPSLHFSPLSLLFLWLLLPSPPLFTLFCLSIPWFLLWSTISTLVSLITLLHLSLFYACLIFFYMNSLDFFSHLTVHYSSVNPLRLTPWTNWSIYRDWQPFFSFFFPLRKKFIFVTWSALAFEFWQSYWWYIFTLFSAITLRPSCDSILYWCIWLFFPLWIMLHLCMLYRISFYWFLPT